MTWLQESVGDNNLTLNNYNLLWCDRSPGTHGGVCTYIKESVKTKRLQELEDPTFKVLQSYIRPPRLLRGINCVITACVYHPPSSNNTKMLECLSDAIPHVEGLFPGCGIIIIAGDFKQLDTKHLCWDFCPKQLVHQPTWGAIILDLVLTNMYNFYDSKPAVLLPPFGLSDHNAVAVWLKTRVSTPTPSRKIVIKRDICPSHKMKLGQYLSEIDWHLNCYAIRNASFCVLQLWLATTFSCQRNKWRFTRMTLRGYRKNWST